MNNKTTNIALAHSAFLTSPNTVLTVEEMAFNTALPAWIPVKEIEGVPAEYESREVLICTSDRKVTIGFQTTSYEWCDRFGKVMRDKPTHWQPLPLPPSE